MKNPDGKRLYIHDVALRDGLQIEPVFVPTESKIALLDLLSRSGLAKIEVTSFTSPKAIPALADAEAVMQGITRVPGVEYAVLVPNLRGAERALRCEVDELNLVISVSQTHNLANLRLSHEQSLAQCREVLQLAAGQAEVNLSLSTAFGCPFEGFFPDSVLFDMVQRLVDQGVRRLTLCDTTGMANPAQVERLCSGVRSKWPDLVLTAHFHNTRGMGLANALAALDAGIDRFDSSLGGLGGCPFAPGASGNVCTEDLVHMFDSMAYHTAVDLDCLIAAAGQIAMLVGHDVPGQVMKAGASDRRFAAPAGLGESAGQTRLAGLPSSDAAALP